MDLNLVEMWLKKDQKRWLAGALAGAFAGLVATAFAMGFAGLLQMNLLYPIKVAALPIYGPEALETSLRFGAFLVGFLTIEIFSAFLGAVYAHFTGTNHLPSLLGVGLTWGAFSWVFLINLFSPAFRDVYVAEVPRGASLIVCLFFGVALTSVAFFDRVVRGGRH